MHIRKETTMTRRTLLQSAALGGVCWVAAVSTSASAKPLEGKDRALDFWNLEEILVLENGDGNPDFMHVKHQVRFVEEHWFNGQARGQAAHLFVVISDEPTRKYVALSSRRAISIEDQMLESGMASVVVNIVLNPTNTYGQDIIADARAVGMTVLRRIDDPRFANS